MSVFMQVADPYLRRELRRLHDIPKALMIVNLLLVFTPIVALYFIGYISFMGWIHFGLYCITLALSSVIFSMSRYHACLNTSLNNAQFTFGLLLVLLAVVYTPIAGWLGSRIPDPVNTAFLVVVPLILAVLHLITFSIQCSDMWKYAKGVAMGSSQWQYSGNQKFITNTVVPPAPGQVQQMQHAQQIQPTPRV